jgi:lipooligosaccharide transport system permease protein
VSTPAPLRVVEVAARGYARSWRVTTLAAVVSPVLFLLAMGVGLGSLVDRGGGGSLAGGSYLAFLAPGLLVASAMQAAVAESTWPVRLGVQIQKTYVAALATPLSASDLLLGLLGWVAIRLLAGSAVFAAAAIALGALDLGGAVVAVPAAALTGLAFAAPVAAWAATLQRDPPVVAVTRFGVVPLFLFSGAFFPIAQLPVVLQGLAVAAPLWHGVELARAAALGTAPAWSAWAHVAYLLGWIAVGTVIARWAFVRRLVR